jgi:hypothetical protein
MKEVSASLENPIISITEDLAKNKNEEKVNNKIKYVTFNGKRRSLPPLED